MSVLCASNASNRLAHASSDDILVGKSPDHIFGFLALKVATES